MRSTQLPQSLPRGCRIDHPAFEGEARQRCWELRHHPLEVSALRCSVHRCFSAPLPRPRSFTEGHCCICMFSRHHPLVCVLLQMYCLAAARVFFPLWCIPWQRSRWESLCRVRCCPGFLCGSSRKTSPRSARIALWKIGWGKESPKVFLQSKTCPDLE